MDLEHAFSDLQSDGRSTSASANLLLPPPDSAQPAARRSRAVEKALCRISPLPCLPGPGTTMLQALGSALQADEVALLVPTQRPNSALRLAVRVREPVPGPVMPVPTFGVTLGPGRDREGWIEYTRLGCETYSHLRTVPWQDARPPVVLDLVRDRHSEPFNASDLSRLRQLLPGLALALRSALDCDSTQLASSVLERLPTAVALIDSDRRVLAQNTPMRLILARGDHLRRVQGLLASRPSAGGEQLLRAIRQIAEGEARHSELISLERDEGLQPYLACVERHEPVDLLARSRPMRLRLNVVDPDEASDDTVAALAQNYGLTRAETEVVKATLRGLDVFSCAEQLQLAVSTVRWHQKRIFAKTGTGGRSNLILLFLRSARLLGG